MPYNPSMPLENLDPDYPYDNYPFSSNRYKDKNGKKYKIMFVRSKNGGRIMRKSQKKDGTWTEWYYDKSNYV